MNSFLLKADSVNPYMFTYSRESTVYNNNDS